MDPKLCKPSSIHVESIPEERGNLLRAVQAEALPVSVMNGLTEPFMIPYALALGASPLEAGLLSSVRNLVLSLSQLKSAEAVTWFRSRRTLVLWTAGLHALLLFPLAFVAPIFGTWAVFAMIVIYTLATTISAFGGPAWGSIVSEYLKPEERGGFFGRRALLSGLWTTGAGLAAGGLLYLLSFKPVFGFAVLCILAGLFRLASWILLRKLEDVPCQEPQEQRIRFGAFLARVRHDNFVRYTLCASGLSFAVYLGSPYLSVYLLKELHYDYLTYALVAQTGTLMGSLMIPRWGRVGDLRGNWTVLRLAMAGVCLPPILWLVSSSPAWMLMTFFLGGLLWGGINLSLVNFVYDAAPRELRARYLAYFNVLNGLGVSLGALTGGLLLKILPPLLGSSYATLFVVSAAARFLAAGAFRRYVREVRSVASVGLREVMFDLAGQRVIHVLGFLSVRPWEERVRASIRSGGREPRASMPRHHHTTSKKSTFGGKHLS